jgi:pimeloyl-ACP methyl ester carboxylesterase
MQDLAKDAEALIRSLGLTRYVLIGHSMGGKAAQLLASKRPQGLEALILVAPAPPTPINLTEAERNQRIQAYQKREAVEFLILNVLTAVPVPDPIREQIIEDSSRARRLLNTLGRRKACLKIYPARYTISPSPPSSSPARTSRWKRSRRSSERWSRIFQLPG